MEQQNNLLEGNIVKTLLIFAGPFLVANLLQALYGAADLLIVGKFSSSAEVSAVATGSQFMQTITGVIVGINTGATVLIGQYFGKKKYKHIADTMGTVICIFAIMAVILTVVMVVFTGNITTLMRTPVQATEYTKEFILISSCGIPFIIGYNAVSGILRGLGNSKAPLFFIAIACLINIALDLILVAGFHMGSTGAAISTVTAQSVSFLLGIIFFKKKGFCFEFNRTHIKLQAAKAKIILKLGLPIALQDGLVNIAFLVVTAIINTMGLTASASVGVVEKLIVFSMIPPFAFASAIAVMTAQNIGAGKPKRAKQSLYTGIGFSLIFGIIFCIYSQWNPKSLISLFSTDRAVIVTASLYLKSYSIDCILVCFVFCINSFLVGYGNSMFPMIQSTIATFLIRIPVPYVLSKMPGVTLYQIGFASPLASALSIVMCMIYMRHGRYNKRHIY
ncbi:MATE family efflux transporter [Clostridium akagii]|uniref:MATE family efflux transporter n=1 Tax=Clostridium akagii TaxID=91623 RepID=UPI00047A53CC|nr:MATE family efflux transporter [Clostridium akagii]